MSLPTWKCPGLDAGTGIECSLGDSGGGPHRPELHLLYACERRLEAQGLGAGGGALCS